MPERSFPWPLGRQAIGTRGLALEDGRAGPLLLTAVLFVGFIGLPLVALVARALGGPGLLPAMTSPLVLQALRVTLTTTATTIICAVIVGTPLAYLLARRRFRGKWLVDLAVDLPLVLPPVVAGTALLMAFGRRGLIGPFLAELGLELPFTAVAVVMAQLFVGGPFYVRSARVGFATIDPALEEAAAIDGASTFETFRWVTLPLATPGIATGLVLCAGRAVSEFGATLLFAGNLTGQTQTMALAIMQALEVDLAAALALATLLVLISAALLLASRSLAGGRRHG